MIPAEAFAKHGPDCSDVEYWVIVSQTCNLYNISFERVPVFELIGARAIAQCDAGKMKGDNPRILHVEAQSPDALISLELDIQTRRWLPRVLLAKIPAPDFAVLDAMPGQDADWLKKQWQDNLAGWLARSYTRVALPDEFNTALADSRIKDVLETKLAKRKDELYGIYMSLDSDSQEPWEGRLGEMPPPFLLEITLVAHEGADPEELAKSLTKQLFDDKVTDPTNKNNKISRAELGAHHGIKIIRAGISAKTVSEITLQELKTLIRYSLVDHLSDSSQAADA